MPDSYVQVSVSMPEGEPFGFKMKIKNVYGVMRRADDPKNVFRNLIAGALSKHFGGNAIIVESTYKTRKIKNDIP